MAERQSGDREEPEVADILIKMFIFTLFIYFYSCFFSQAETARRERLTVFRPESAPTVLAGNAHVRVLQPIDMSPEASLQGPPGAAEDLSRDAMGEFESLL